MDLRSRAWMVLGCATIAVALVVGAASLLVDHDGSLVMRNADGTIVDFNTAAYIRSSDAEFPLGTKLEVYGESGQRVALSDVDESTYNGFFMQVNTASPCVQPNLQAALDAGVLRELGDGETFAADTLDDLAAYFTEDDVVYIEPAYEAHLDESDKSVVSPAKLKSRLPYVKDDDALPTPAPLEPVEVDDLESAPIEDGRVAPDRPLQTPIANADGSSSAFIDAINEGAPPNEDSTANENLLLNEDPAASLDAHYEDQVDLQTIKAPQAWELEKDGIPIDGAGVVVGVIDSGLVGTGKGESKHVDLDYSRVLPGYDFTGTTTIDYRVQLGTPDENGHGTFCAGEIAAERFNGLGVAGIAPGASVRPYKTFKGPDAAGNSEWVIQAINLAVDNLATEPTDILSMSLGISPYSQTLDKACRRADDAGIILVASAGNDSRFKNNYPAALDCVIGVSATKMTGEFDYSYSNYGRDNVFISAPGSSLWGLDINGGYCQKSGTSMSCPEVSALAALAKQANAALDQDAFMELLRTTSQDAGDEGYDEYYGWGVIDCKVLVTKALGEESLAAPDATGEFGPDGQRVRWKVTGDGASVPGQLELSPANGSSSTLDLSSGVVPWAKFAAQIKSINVAPGVTVSGTLNGAFDGMTSLEKLDLGNLVVPNGAAADSNASVVNANVSATETNGMPKSGSAPVFAGLTSLKTLSLGDGWQETKASFPDANMNVDCFGGWLDSKSGETTSSEHIYDAGAQYIPEGWGTYLALEHRYEVSESTDQTIHHAASRTKVCTMAGCGHTKTEKWYNQVMSEYIAKSDSGYCMGTIGNVKWYITSDATPDTDDDCPEYKRQLIIYPYDAVGGTLDLKDYHDRGFAPAWASYSHLIDSVYVMPGVNAGPCLYAVFFNLSSVANFYLDGLDMTNAELTDLAFYGCTSLKSISFANQNLSGLEYAKRMFEDCTSLKSVRFANQNLSRLIYANGMFQGCTSLEDISFVDQNLSEIGYANSMFEGCTSLKSVEFGAFGDPNYVLFVQSMFKDCTNLKYADLSHFNITPFPLYEEGEKVYVHTNVANMLEGCSLQKLILGDGWKTPEYFYPGSVEYSFPVDVSGCSNSSNDPKWRKDDGSVVTPLGLAQSPAAGVYSNDIHSLELHEGHPAGCTAGELAPSYVCSACGKIFATEAASEEIDAPVEGEPLGHEWGEWTVVKKPTATQDGIERRSCQRGCGESEQRAIAATGAVPPDSVSEELSYATTDSRTAYTVMQGVAYEAAVGPTMIRATVPAVAVIAIKDMTAYTPEGSSTHVWYPGEFYAPSNYRIENECYISLDLVSISGEGGGDWNLIPAVTEGSHAGEPDVRSAGLSGSYQAISLSINGHDVSLPESQALVGQTIPPLEAYNLALDGRIALSPGHAELPTDMQMTIATLYYTIALHEE